MQHSPKHPQQSTWGQDARGIFETARAGTRPAPRRSNGAAGFRGYDPAQLPRRRPEFLFGKLADPRKCTLRGFLYLPDGHTGPTDHAVIGALIEPRIKWRAMFCCGCSRMLHERHGRIYCAICGMYSGSGRRVDGSGGTWIEDGSDYQRGAERDHGEVTTDREGIEVESLSFARSKFRSDRNYDPRKPQQAPRANNAHFREIEWMARTARGRALLSLWMLGHYRRRQKARREVVGHG